MTGRTGGGGAIVLRAMIAQLEHLADPR